MRGRSSSSGSNEDDIATEPNEVGGYTTCKRMEGSWRSLTGKLHSIWYEVEALGSLESWIVGKVKFGNCTG
jgi:hypothetical protein